MSFIVKGAEAPKTCMDCPLADVEQGWCASEMVTIIDFDERPVECPLVALPDKHGRLVDADEIKNKNPLHMELDVPYVTEVTVGEIIDDAPTIVEAEGSE